MVVPVGGLIVGLIVMSVNRQFDMLIQKLDRRFGAVNEKFGAVNRQFDSVNRQFDSVNEKFDRQFDSVNQQFDSVNRQFDVLRAENRAAHAQIGANVDDLRGDMAGVRATLDALLLKLVPAAGSRAAGRREGEARR